ncbi:MAG: DUF481 domain-containing protein [Polyangiaceae bacterium]|nr:DUF481 domain-containing protein [Polyangiaceae bacterium]
MKGLIQLLVVFSILVCAAPARAQEAHQLTERAVETAPVENKIAWTLIAGGVLNTGNTESWSINSGTNLQLIRGRHALLAEAAFNTAAANIVDTAAGTETGYQTNARNLNSRVRYDFFFTPFDAAYVSVRHRWDTFVGLDTRLQNQFGYLRNFFRQDKHRFWGEVGYDLTYDNLDPDPLRDPADPLDGIDNDMDGDIDEILDGTEVVHAGRLYLGYMNRLNEHVLFETGAEALFNFQVGNDIRFNYDARILATLAARLQLELRFRLQYDNVPVPQKERLDTTSIANLIVTLI